MTEYHDGREVEVRGKGDYRTGSLDRAKAMLQALLVEADAQIGRYRFDAEGTCEVFRHLSKPILEIQPCAQVVNMILVRLKSGGHPESTLRGVLRLPPGANRAKILQDMGPALDNFNGEGWKSVLDNIPPGPYPERVSSLIGRVNGSGAILNPVARAGEISALAVERMRGQDMETPSKSEVSHEHKLAEFLRQVLAQDGVINGLFTGQGVTRFSQPLFPQAAMIWQRTGILRELAGLKWIRRVGHGEYQVEQAFVTKYALAISLTPRDKVIRVDKKKSTKGPKPNGHAQNGCNLQALLDQVDQIALLIARIQEEAKREERELEASLAEAQAAVVRAQELVAERQAALDTFKERLTPLLTPLGATVASVPVARS